MPSSYSTNLRLEKPADGEKSGLWGDIVNATTDLLEQAIVGSATIAMGDANQTLTTANGSSDQARCALIVATGALTADRSIFIPAVAKWYIVRNNTTGSHNIKVGVSGTGHVLVSIVPGEWALVYCDGDDTSIVGAMNGTTIDPSRLPTPTSSALGGVKSLASASHKFVTSIGTDGLPVAAQPTTSDISGLATVASSGSASDLSTGTLPAARLPNPTSSTLGGVKSLAATSHEFLTSIGTNGLPVAAQPTASDISGLGTSATVDTGNSGAVIPLLNGTNTWSGTTNAFSGTGGIVQLSPSASTPRIHFKDTSSNYIGYLDANATSGAIHVILTNASGSSLTQYTFADGTFNVGSNRIIGVADATAATDAMNRESCDARYPQLGTSNTYSGNTNTFSAAGGSVLISPTALPLIYFKDSSSNFIGYVAANSGNSSMRIATTSSSGSTTNHFDFIDGKLDVNSNKIVNLADATAATDAMNRESSDARYGQLGAANSWTGTLNDFTTAVSFESSFSLSHEAEFSLSASGTFVEFSIGATIVGSISSNGVSTAYNTSSDRRIKVNDKPIDNSGEIIDALRPVSFDFTIGNKAHSHGFIAQELYEVFPEAVTKGDDDLVKNPGDDGFEMWGVDQAKLMAVAIAEMQALRSRVAELEARVAKMTT